MRRTNLGGYPPLYTGEVEVIGMSPEYDNALGYI